MSLTNFIIRDKRSYGSHALEVNERVPHSRLQLSGDIAKELLLEDELALFVLLRALIGLVVLPPDHLFTLPASDVSHGVSAGSHVAVAGLGSLGVHHAVEEEGFAMLATEVTADNLIVVGQVSLAVLAAVDALGVQVDVVGEAHLVKR